MTNNNLTPTQLIYMSIKNNDLLSVKKHVLKNKSNLDFNTLFEYCIKYDNIDALIFVLSLRSDIDPKTLVLHCCTYNSINCLKHIYSVFHYSKLQHYETFVLSCIEFNSTKVLGFIMDRSLSSNPIDKYMIMEKCCLYNRKTILSVLAEYHDFEKDLVEYAHCLDETDATHFLLSAYLIETKLPKCSPGMFLQRTSETQ
jgi:hypothetical protein